MIKKDIISIWDEQQAYKQWTIGSYDIHNTALVIQTLIIQALDRCYVNIVIAVITVLDAVENV